MSSSNNTSIILGRSEIPPYSPIYWKPPVEWTPETFSRDRSRVRSVFDDHVERAKALKHEKPAKAHAKKRAQRLGLQVDIIEAKGLSWRAIQAQPPVVLTAGPTSPARTVMQPALYYPSAERLCRLNQSNTSFKQTHVRVQIDAAATESARWGLWAQRESVIAEWEKQQSEEFHIDLLRKTLFEQLQQSAAGNLPPWLKRKVDRWYGGKMLVLPFYTSYVNPTMLHEAPTANRRVAAAWPRHLPPPAQIPDEPVPQPKQLSPLDGELRTNPISSVARALSPNNTNCPEHLNTNGRQSTLFSSVDVAEMARLEARNGSSSSAYYNTSPAPFLRPVELSAEPLSSRKQLEISPRPSTLSLASFYHTASPRMRGCTLETFYSGPSTAPSSAGPSTPKDTKSTDERALSGKKHDLEERGYQPSQKMRRHNEHLTTSRSTRVMKTSQE